ncbi:hypothetical protein N431DRAFT_556649 [Stipitochalara longipes BDJ]|nr:hypothetical protein N431DRAFT_556649 [Stipitochalara longipes BDJ]
MIPRLQFWKIDNVWIGPGSMDFSVYIQANESGLYPDVLTSDYLPTQCLQANSSILSDCPSYGMRRWLMTDEGLSGIESNNLNKSIEDGGWVRYMVGTGPPVFRGTQSSYIASTLSNFLGKALVSFSSLLQSISPSTMGGGDFTTTIQTAEDILARYDLSFRSAGKQIATRKPLVEIECSGYPAGTEFLGLPHDMFFLASSPDFSNTQWSYPASDFASLSVDPNSDIVNSSWVNSELFLSDQPRPSLGALFATPETFFGQNGSYSLYSCAIDARWTYTQALLDASSGQPIVFDGNPDPNGALVTSITGVGPVPATLPSIQISESWSAAINPPWIDSITSPVPGNRRILDTIGQICLDSYTSLNATLYSKPFSDGLDHRVMVDSIHQILPIPMPMLQCLQVTLAVYLTDALSRVQDTIPAYFVRSGRLEPMNHPSTDMFLVQDLYYDEVVTWNPPEPGDQPGYDNETAPGEVKTVSKADLADPTRFTEMYMNPARYGYGYGFQDSKLVFFGTSVLLLHVALCVVYVAWILGVGEYRGTGWGSLGELLRVALGSDAVLLGTEKGAWREKIVVEETQTEKPDVRRRNRTVLIRAPEDNHRRTSTQSDISRSV